MHRLRDEKANTEREVIELQKEKQRILQEASQEKIEIKKLQIDVRRLTALEDVLTKENKKLKEKEEQENKKKL